MTASEPLSLEEELAMQREWREDEKKCTFIVLDQSARPTFPRLAQPCWQWSTQKTLLIRCMTRRDDTGKDDITTGMAGDVNLYLGRYEDDDPTEAEIEIMVAEPSARRKGIATEALQLMMAYGVEVLGLRRFVAKIKDNNAASIALFESRLGYIRESHCDYFKEVTLVLEAREPEAMERAFGAALAARGAAREEAYAG